MSEKSFALSQTTNTFAIDVPAGLDSVEVKAAVEKQFEVKVAKVRMVNRKGKVKRVINLTGKRANNRQGVKTDIRKAYVTLAEGSHLPFFAAEEKEIEDAKKEAEKKAKKDEKPAKKSKKESK
jgi:large subunit ribosomal protein L23